MKALNHYLALALLGLSGGIGNRGWAFDLDPEADGVKVVNVVASSGEADKADSSTGEKKKSIIIKRIEASGGAAEEKERTWLGVGLAEPDEALVAQLGLKDGAGLVVTYVAKDSPAEKAGLKRNDILLELEGQSLVVAAQLQKLVQARKEGDKVAVKYLRGGKKESATVTLGKSKGLAMGADGDANSFVIHSGEPGALAFTMGGGTAAGGGGAHGEHMIVLKKALDDAKMDQKRIQVEVRRSVDEARKAMEEALRTTKGGSFSAAQQKELEALAKAGVFVPQDANVTIRRIEKSSKSMVTADDAGTVVLVKNPKLRLTAHDKDGKMLFDGEIETKEQREKVPADLLKKVEPMIQKFSSDADE